MISSAALVFLFVWTMLKFCTTRFQPCAKDYNSGYIIEYSHTINGFVRKNLNGANTHLMMICSK